MKKRTAIIAVLAALLLFQGCALLESLNDPTPTQTLMEGVWEVTGVYDLSTDSTVNMIDSLGLGYKSKRIPLFVKLSEDGDMHSTAGPLFLYLVYGNRNYTNFFGKVDEIFRYTDFETTNGDWSIRDGIVSDFDIQVKLTPPGMKTMTNVMELFGVNVQKIKTFLLHRFNNVTVAISGSSPDKMTWRWTNSVDATYFTSGDNFDNMIWVGWEAKRFTRCKVVFEKRVGTLQDLVNQSK